MDEKTEWSLRAVAVLAFAAFVAAVDLYVLATYAEISETLADGIQPSDLAALEPRFFASFVASATVAGGLVGGPAWWVVVEQWDRSSVTRRGALAGGLTGAGAVPVAMLGLVALGPWIGLGPADLIGAILAGLIGIVVVGWATIPVGAIAGYLFALRRGDGVTPVWRTLRRRLG